VAGKRVLDAACGPGLYAAELLARGADVTGFDVSPRMVEIAREQAPGGEFRVHDLNEPLTWLPDASVDLALCALASEYIDDRVGALRDLRRVLRPGGALVLSRLHPTGEWLRNGGNYHEPRVITETWEKGWTLRFWLVPLETACEEFAAAGFLIERLLEPRPDPATAADNPRRYARLSREPAGHMVFRLRPA
jgi:SAM-dependent methyltransferase